LGVIRFGMTACECLKGRRWRSGRKEVESGEP
jgi:hypothetical protein